MSFATGPDFKNYVAWKVCPLSGSQQKRLWEVNILLPSCSEVFRMKIKHFLVDICSKQCSVSQRMINNSFGSKKIQNNCFGSRNNK